VLAALELESHPQLLVVCELRLRTGVAGTWHTPRTWSVVLIHVCTNYVTWQHRFGSSIGLCTSPSQVWAEQAQPLRN
jgi:hypothetical protein